MKGEGWESVVRVLSAMPGVAARLARAHGPDPGGYCRTCTTPGRGTPMVPFPCGLHVLASAALERLRITS